MCSSGVLEGCREKQYVFCLTDQRHAAHKHKYIIISTAPQSAQNKGFTLEKDLKG